MPIPDAILPASGVTASVVGYGYAQTTVNVVVFRRHSLFTFGGFQFAAFYDAEGRVVLARRRHGTHDWLVRTTPLTGSLTDAHNAISIAADGAGHLHLAWNHHGNPLTYCRSTAPLSLDFLPPQAATGRAESSVTYPEFHVLPPAGPNPADLLLILRDGRSGKGDVVLKRHHTASQCWTDVHPCLIDGEGRRNAYWQACTDSFGTLHLSWVWRESPDVATNHDLCYARSPDAGQTWTDSAGRPLVPPFTLDNAEYAARIPQGHELINQTSIAATRAGRPVIATYFRPPGTDIPQYHLLFHTGSGWQTRQVGTLTTPFRLGGGGTKRVPISRPQVLCDRDGVHVLFRAEELGNLPMLGTCPELATADWALRPLSATPLGQWEPTYDEALWRDHRRLHIFAQRAEQIDAEGVGTLGPQPVTVLEVELPLRPV